MFELPRCDDLDEDWFLTNDEKRELIIEMATKGTGAMDDYLKRVAKDKNSTVAKRIQKIRSDLEKQSQGFKKLLTDRYDRKRKNLSNTYKRIRERSRRDEFESSLSDSKIGNMISLEDLGIEEDSLIDILLDLDKYGRKVSRLGRLWFRIKETFVKIFGAVFRFFAWLLIKLHILHPVEPGHDMPPPYQFMLSFGAMRSPYASVESNLNEAISSSPDMAQVIKNKMGGGMKGALKAAWEKMLNPRRFKKRVQQMVADELKDKLKETREESKKKKEEFERLLEAEQKRQEEIQEEESKKVRELDDDEREEMNRQYREMSKSPLKKIKEEISDELEKMGLVEKDGDEIAITSRLIDIFSEIVFSMEVKNIPSHYASKFGGGGVSTGIYNTRRMRSLNEMSRMDIVRSMVESRINNPKSHHIYNENIYIYDEEKGSWQHVVLAFDKSGSMADNRKMEAAKRAVLALYKAVKNSNVNNVIDLVSFDTSVNVMDLMEVWSSEPNGFTNTGEALKVAGELLRDSKTSKKNIYLITDGLPEAYTANGREYAGDFEKSMEYALTYAEELKKIPTLKFTIILLEVKDEKFIDAAKKISKVLNGNIILTNPKKLASELLIQYSKTRIV
ncbi:MAG: VWA domain-containing protein [Candidatus Thermoplasmatota archaeon]|jgi:hypothetical protein|nr:VWA domain-containing protein [Candidatus Thermoplasmatota archaeon]